MASLVPFQPTDPGCAPMIDRQSGMLTSLGSRVPLASLIQKVAVAEYLSFHRAAKLSHRAMQRQFGTAPADHRNDDLVEFGLRLLGRDLACSGGMRQRIGCT